MRRKIGRTKTRRTSARTSASARTRSAPASPHKNTHAPKFACPVPIPPTADSGLLLCSSHVSTFPHTWFLFSLSNLFPRSFKLALAPQYYAFMSSAPPPESYPTSPEHVQQRKPRGGSVTARRFEKMPASLHSHHTHQNSSPRFSFMLL
jgi:hypothetical protein